VPLRHAVSAAADRFSLDGRLTKLFVALCFPEVARYLAADDAPARVQAREHVAATIADRRGRVVIAHSLGTVVAYEALYARPDLEVGLLVTLGSPLALPGVVFPRLQPRPSGGIGLRPVNVRRWVNISDYGDPIAILRPFKTYFPLPRRRPRSDRKRRAVRLPPRRSLPGLRVPRRHPPASNPAHMTACRRSGPGREPRAPEQTARASCPRLKLFRRTKLRADLSAEWRERSHNDQW